MNERIVRARLPYIRPTGSPYSASLPRLKRRRRRTRAMVAADEAAKRGRRTSSSQLNVESVHD
jgi:hypothetical protein